VRYLTTTDSTDTIRTAYPEDPSPMNHTLHQNQFHDLVQDRIGDHLRSMYDELVQQPVPDRFVELLNRLEKRTDAVEK